MWLLYSIDSLEHSQRKCLLENVQLGKVDSFCFELNPRLEEIPVDDPISEISPQVWSENLLLEQILIVLKVDSKFIFDSSDYLYVLKLFLGEKGGEVV